MSPDPVFLAFRKLLKFLSISFNFHPTSSCFRNSQISILRIKLSPKSLRRQETRQIRHYVHPYNKPHKLAQLCIVEHNIFLLLLFKFLTLNFHNIVVRVFCKIAPFFEGCISWAVSLWKSLYCTMIWRYEMDVKSFLFFHLALLNYNDINLLIIV